MSIKFRLFNSVFNFNRSQCSDLDLLLIYLGQNNSWKQVIHEPKYMYIFMTFIRIYTLLIHCTCIFKIIKTLERITPLPMHPSTSVSKQIEGISYYQYCKYSFAISSERHFCFCSRWNIAQVNSLASPHLSFFYPKRRDWLVVDWSKEDLIN